ncbi:hypothetical protein M9Y10_000514 [Tritrichomonas musculus]|uniref:Tubby C-terminal domain-containing protein n=1 Tax=Tritrichomonas musculus TaxID=1915356 RepID=A0ABR2L5F2_9EUKA
MINQTFPIFYQNECYMVDPSLMCNSSKKFSDIYNDIGTNCQNAQIKINYDQFSPRSVANFLKICQNQQTDVQNSELEEICLIAKMFRADEIYNTGINFIQSNIDPNYFIPYNKFDESNGNHYLILESEKSIVEPHQIDFDELEFDDSYENIPNEKDNNKNNNLNNSQVQKQPEQKKSRSVCYQITSDNKFMKCPRLYLMKDGKVLYMAKLKNDEIYIGEGENFHINENKIENCAKITRKCEDYNIISTDEQEFKVQYVRFTDGRYSIKTIFSHQGHKLSWRPARPKTQAGYNGDHNHIARPSKKNIILQNPRNHPTFIFRKMSKKTYEVECHPALNPLVVFSIAASQLVGPVLF